MLDTAIEKDHVDKFVDLVHSLKAFEQRKYLNAVIVYVTKHFFQPEIVSKEDVPISQSPIISGAAFLLYKVIEGNETLKDHAVTSFTRSTIPSLDESFGTRRTVIAALAQDEGQHPEFRFTGSR